MNERARPQSITQHAHVTVSLHHIVALIDAYADARLTADFGVSFSEYHVIAVLFDEEPTDVTGLASCLGISKAAVSKRLPSLVRSGLVTTNPDPDHGRRILITLTDQARAIVAQAAPQLEAEFHNTLADSGVDLTHLNTDLTRLIAILERTMTPQGEHS